MSKSVSARTVAPRRRGGETLVQLYGWDARSSTWHGPNEFSAGEPPSAVMLEALRGAPGPSWYGHVQCCTSRFFTMVHEAADCATAMIYCNDSKAGPAEIVAVLPAELRSALRSDFAFEFLSFARFLGSISAESELRLHEAITAAIAETDDAHALVLSLGSGLWPSDDDHTLSACIEKVAVTLLAWQSER
jgi:hypothetical protein